MSGRPCPTPLNRAETEPNGMKATIERATLLKSLGHVQSVVERRNTIPILSNVLIDASQGGTIRLMATDLDLQIVENVQASVEGPGATTVSAHTLFDIVRKLPEGSQVRLDAAEGKMLVQAGPRPLQPANAAARRLPDHRRGGRCRRASSCPRRRLSSSSTRRASPSRPKRRVIISTASSCMSPTIRRPCSRPRRPTGIAWPA